MARVPSRIVPAFSACEPMVNPPTSTKCATGSRKVSASSTKRAILREAAAGSCSEAFQSGIGVPSAVVFMLPAAL